MAAAQNRASKELKPALSQDGTLPQASLLELFPRLLDKGANIRTIYVPGQWLDVDDAADFTKAGKFL